MAYYFWECIRLWVNMKLMAIMLNRNGELDELKGDRVQFLLYNQCEKHFVRLSKF